MYGLARQAAWPWRFSSLYEDCVQVAAVSLWLSEGSGLSTGLRVVDARRRVVDETSGALTGVYHEDELSGLREDWPE